MNCIFSIDVEDWFHILDLPTTPPMGKWESLPSHVERDFQTLLNLMREHDVRCTCFMLGWVAERFPNLVKAASDAGHEIASHGYSHQLVYEMSDQEFREDIRRAKELVENITGKPALGYRAPGFSVTQKTPWYYDALADEGFRYSSSVFPAARGHGGIAGARIEPHFIGETGVLEFPITVIEKFGKRICLFGGGYLRLFPVSFIRKATRELLERGDLVNFYIHPREINPTHPRLEMSLKRRFKTYVNLRTTQPKLATIFSEFQFRTFAEHFEEVSN